MKRQYERQIQETVRRGSDVLLQMMQRKQAHQIDVSELCRLAGIGRTLR